MWRSDVTITNSFTDIKEQAATNAACVCLVNEGTSERTRGHLDGILGDQSWPKRVLHFLVVLSGNWLSDTK